MKMPTSNRTRRNYIAAVACYLAIPVVVIVGVRLSNLIDPEMARATDDYARNFHLLQLVATGALLVTAGVALVLWVSTCYLVLRSRHRSWPWLLLAVAGPFGFMFIAMLADRTPAPDDLHQQFNRKLKMYWRVPLELLMFVSAWVLAYQCVWLKRELLIAFESYSTGTPTETIIARQDASSGMYAFGEGLEATYLFTLIYLLWPIVFNLAGQYSKRRISARTPV
jgi:hypothetical protein